MEKIDTYSIDFIKELIETKTHKSIKISENATNIIKIYKTFKIFYRISYNFN